MSYYTIGFIEGGQREYDEIDDSVAHVSETPAARINRDTPAIDFAPVWQ
jgi:hypothetical protein